MALVKSVEIDIGVKGDAASKAKLDAISARAEELKKAFPEYVLKINNMAASEKLKVFRADMASVAAQVTKPMDTVVLTEKSKAKLLEIRAEAEKLKKEFPEFTVKIDDAAARRQLEVFAADSKKTLDKITGKLGSAGSGGGLFGGLLGGGADAAGGGAKAGGGIAGAVGSLPLPAIGGIAAAAAAAIPVIASLATVALGAGAGLAAFAAVGAQAYGKLTSDIAALHTANENFSQSALNVDTALSASAADTAIYNKSLAGMPPNLRAAAKLLGDQSVRWQDLSQSQQNNVVALANNSAAVRSMLPAQKSALTALLAGKKAWDDMSPAQQAAATSMNKISDSWGKLTTAMEPSVMKVIAAGADQVSKAIGPIGVLAKEAVPGITQMVGVLGTGLIGFLKGIAPLVGPSLGALNMMLGSITGAINKSLVPAMVSGMPQFVKMAVFVGHVTAGLIDFLGALFRVSAWIISQGIVAWQRLSAATDQMRIFFVRAGHEIGASVDKMIAQFENFRHRTAVIFDGIRGDVGHYWDMAWNNTIARSNRGAGDSFRILSGWEHNTAHWFDVARHDMAAIWDSAWNNTVGRTQRGVNDVLNWTGRIHGGVANQFAGAGWWLFRAGQDVLQGLWNGLVNVWNKVSAWISSLAGWIKNNKGPISLDRTLLEPAGRALMQGLKVGLEGGFVGIKDIVSGMAGNIGNQFSGLFSLVPSIASKIGGFFSHLVGGGGSGVERWRGLVMQALSMEGLSPSLAGNVLYQMSTESGGNPNAINLTDSNAAAGDPSRGLMQTIGSTFSAFHWPGTSFNIYDPLANIAAAINYARHAYGPNLANSFGGIGSGHGYAAGTASASPGWAWVGERGPELMRFRGGEQVVPAGRGGGNSYQITIHPTPLARPADIGREVVSAIRAYEKGSGKGWRS